MAAVEVLLQAMAQHREVAAVQENAAGALWDLAASSEATEQRLAVARAMEALSGSPTRESWRRCSWLWHSTERWPSCR